MQRDLYAEHSSAFVRAARFAVLAAGGTMLVGLKRLGVTIIALCCLLGGSATAGAGGGQWAYGNMSLSPDATLPAPAGVTITWTATWLDFADDTNVEFEFWRSDNGVWQRVQSYGAANTYAWTTVAGTHELQARVRRIGSGVAYDAYRNTGSFVITAPSSAPPVLTALRTTTVFPAPSGISVTWTAVASGSGLQYEFWRADNGVWQMVQPFSPLASYTWVATEGMHALQARVRRIGATVAYESYFGTGYFEVLGPRPVASVGLAVNRTSFPMLVYRSVKFVAAAMGGTVAPEYEFWRNSGGVWRVVQPYSTNPVYEWSTGAGDVGTHVLQVRARNIGATVAYQAFLTSVPFDVVAPVITITSLTMTPTSVSKGPGIEFTATATSTPDVGPPCYQFWRWSGGVWAMVQNYINPAGFSQNNYRWFPTVADTGPNAVQVRVKDCYSPNAYDAYRSTGVFTLDVPAEAKDLIVDSRLGMIGQPMTWTATAVGAPGSTLEYRLWSKSNRFGAPWRMVRDYATNPQIVWTPTTDLDLGTQDLLVWIRRVGSPAAYDAYVTGSSVMVIASEAVISEQKVTLWHGETFLGCFNCPSDDPQSVRNPSGLYGSKDSSTSIWNPNSVYGSPNSIYSVCDASATIPPVLKGREPFQSVSFPESLVRELGWLTLNQTRSGAFFPAIGWLRDTVCQ